MIIQIIGAFIATISLAVLLGVPRKFTLWVGLVGALGWMIYLLLGQGEEHILIRTFIAALVVSLISHSFARVMKAPVTVFLISGILPLVPGTGMYRTVYQLFIGNRSLAGQSFLLTMQMAGMIALSIFIMDSVFRVLLQKLNQQKLNRKTDEKEQNTP